MSEPGLGEKGGDAKPWVTLFLDLLGWSKQLLRYDEVIDYLDDMKKVSKVISDPIYAHQKARLVIEGLMGGPVGSHENEEHQRRLNQLSGIERELFDRMACHEFVVQQFGDSFVVSICVLGDEKLGYGPVVSDLLGLFQMAGGATVMLLSQGIPVRGAIEIGIGTEYEVRGTNRKELVGASIVKAYRLESGVAEYPRVLVGPHLIRFISGLDDGKGDPIVQKTVRGLLPQLQGLLHREGDGSFSLDYLNDVVIGERLVDLARVEDAYRFVVTQYSEATARNDAQLLGRYGLVLKYWLERRGKPPPPTTHPQGSPAHGLP